MGECKKRAVGPSSCVAVDTFASRIQLVSRKTSHAGKTTVTITSNHAKATVIQAAMRELMAFFKELAHTAVQSAIAERVALIYQEGLQENVASLEPGG